MKTFSPFKPFSSMNILILLAAIEKNAWYELDGDGDAAVALSVQNEFSQIIKITNKKLSKHNYNLLDPGNIPIQELREILQDLYNWLENYPRLQKELDFIFSDNPSKDGRMVT